MDTNLPFAELLQEWLAQAAVIREIIRTRDYNQFSREFRKGSRCFNLVREELAGDRRTELLKTYEQPIRQAAAVWSELAEELKLWMGETREKALDAKHANQLSRKVSGTYGYMRRTGKAFTINR
jgi:dsDNA-binding SOS-regulon protein